MPADRVLLSGALSGLYLGLGALLALQVGGSMTHTGGASPPGAAGGGGTGGDVSAGLGERPLGEANPGLAALAFAAIGIPFGLMMVVLTQVREVVSRVCLSLHV